MEPLTSTGLATTRLTSMAAITGDQQVHPQHIETRDLLQPPDPPASVPQHKNQLPIRHHRLDTSRRARDR